jgi:hypothetical protein
MMPNDLLPWETVYQQTQRWLKAGVFEVMAHDLRMLVRQFGRTRGPADGGHSGESHAAIESRERLPRRL